jgi:hypothetical protein
MVELVDLQLLFRLGRTGHLPHTEVGDPLDGGRHCSAHCVVDPAFGVVLFRDDHVAANLLDVLSDALDV